MPPGAGPSAAGARAGGGAGDLHHGGMFPFGGLGLGGLAAAAAVGGRGGGSAAGRNGESWDCMAIVSLKRPPSRGKEGIGGGGGGGMDGGVGGGGGDGREAKGGMSAWLR